MTPDVVSLTFASVDPQKGHAQQPVQHCSAGACSLPTTDMSPGKNIDQWKLLLSKKETMSMIIVTLSMFPSLPSVSIWF